MHGRTILTGLSALEIAAHHRAANALGQGPGVLHDLLAYAVADHLGAACVVGGHLDGDFTGALLELGQRPEPTRARVLMSFTTPCMLAMAVRRSSRHTLVSLAGGFLDDLGGGGLGDLLPGLLGGLEAPRRASACDTGAAFSPGLVMDAAACCGPWPERADVLLGHGRVVEVADDLLKLVGVAAGLGGILRTFFWMMARTSLGVRVRPISAIAASMILVAPPARADCQRQGLEQPDDGQVHGVAGCGGELARGSGRRLRSCCRPASSLALRAVPWRRRAMESNVGKRRRDVIPGHLCNGGVFRVPVVAQRRTSHLRGVGCLCEPACSSTLDPSGEVCDQRQTADNRFAFASRAWV